MKISQRLFLAVVPGIIGLLTVAGLAYWGQYAHEAPDVVVIIAMVATIASLIMAWYNTSYVARRIERLAGTSVSRAARQRDTAAAFRDVAHAITAGVLPDAGLPDELDQIENTVQTLSGAVVRVRDEAQRKEEAATARANEYASLIESVSTLMTARLEEAELPLHVLLSSPFGSLNENQEEMISAAESAVRAAADEIRRLRKLIALDEHSVSIVRKPVNLAELLKPALAIASAHARRMHVGFDSQVSSTSPRVVVDPVHTQDALTTILDWAVANAGPDNSVTVNAHDHGAGEVRITVLYGGTDTSTQDSVDMRLATRLISAQHGRVTREPGRLDLDLPCEGLTSVREIRDNAASIE